MNYNDSCGFIMRLFFLVIAIAFLQTSVAQARGLGEMLWSHTDTYTFFAPTELMDDQGARLSICLKERQHMALLFIPAWNNREYALATNSCDGGPFQPYSRVELAVDKALGKVAETIPRVPPVSFKRYFGAFIPFYIIVLAFYGLQMLGYNFQKMGDLSSKEKLLKNRLLAGLTDEQKNMIEMMIHAVKSDGFVPRKQLQLVQDTVNQVVSIKITAKEASSLIEMSKRRLGAKAFSAFGDGLDKENREELIYVALQTILVAGSPSNASVKFVFKLAKGLKIDKRQVADIVNENGLTPVAMGA